MQAFFGNVSHTIWMILGIFLVIIYNYLVFILAGTILENAKLRGIKLIPLCVINTAIGAIFIISVCTTSLVWYVILFLMLLTEFFFLHKDHFFKVLFVALACMVHVMPLRSICVAVMSILQDKPFFAIVNDIDTLWVSTAVTIFIINIAVLAVLKLVPNDKLRIVGQHREQLLFLNSWLTVANIFLVINSLVYSLDETYSLLNLIQIMTSTAILLSTYIVLFYSFKITGLLGYKDKNLELNLEIQKQQQYRESMLTDSILSFEFDITTNQIISGLDEYKSEFGEQSENTYTQALIVMAQRYVHSDDLIAFIEHSNVTGMMEEYEKGVNEFNIEYRRLTDDGRYIWVKATTNLMCDIATGDIKAFTYIRNIDAEKKERIELEYKAEKDQLTGLYNKAMLTKKISEYLHEPVNADVGGTLFMIDIDDFKNINDSLGHIYGDAVLRELSEKLSKVFREDDYVGRVGGDEFMAFMRGAGHKMAIAEKANEICRIFHNTYQGDRDTVLEITGSIGIAMFPLHGDSFEELYKKADIALYISKNKGKNTYSFYAGENFTEYKSNRADYDDITGTIGFRRFKQEAAGILAENNSTKYMFVRLDINDFKALNGIYGFDAGDKALKDMAKAIALTIESNGTFARMANDNFVVLTGYTDDTDIYRQAESFRESFSKIHGATERDYAITFTIGFGKIEQGETDIVGVIEKASLAHSMAKRNSIGVISYDNSLKLDLEKEQNIEATMHTALEEGNFIFLLQPRYDLRSGNVNGAEALVRWEDRFKALIPPEEFIPLFESNGFIVQLDLYILEQVCKLQKSFLDRGIKPFPISVNHSSLLSGMRDYSTRLTDIINQYGISPDLIELELTENAIQSNAKELVNCIAELKSSGFVVSIDKFGYNCSAVNIFSELHADVLKIDKSLLKDFQTDIRSGIVVSNVIRLANELAMSVVAVGVETQEQADWLASHSCDSVQGFLYSEPITIEAFEKKFY